MGYLTKAILINLFGDEEGIGEAWDMYEIATNWQQFKSVLIIIAGIFFLIVGLGLYVIHIIDKKHWSLYSAIGIIGLSIILIIIGSIIYMRHK